MKIIHYDIKTFLYTPGRYFVIPDFQRPYSWDKANIASFIEDLESVMRENKKHYFGSIVYINEGNNSVIIDGQQRATTVLLMLTALYHIATDRPSSSTISAQQIKENYLYNGQDYSENANRIKLRTVATDNVIFKEIFERADFSKNSKDSRLYQTYILFFDYFNERNDLQKYVDVLEKFEVVTIALDSTDDNPQRIFESINSTGKPLTDGDKIRNFALMLNDSNARNIILNKYWKKIETQLTDINKDHISDFFKYFLTSYLQKEVKIEHVYPEFKNLFHLRIEDEQSNIEKLEKFYTVILSYLNHYLFLKFNTNTDDAYMSIVNEGFRLHFLKIETPYPFLMGALEDHARGRLEEIELLKIFQIVESYLARRIICNIANAGLNNLFSTLHKDINNYLSEYPEERYSNVLGYILTNRSGNLRFPKWSEVESAIKNNPMYSQRNHYINFVLSSIDDQSRESKLLKQIGNGDVQLSIEHIMPQTLSRQWIKDLGDNYEQIHQQYLHTLPNLTLTGYNSRYSNSDFASKKNIENGFNDSPLLINQLVKSFEKWNLSALEERGKWWLGQIDIIWPIPHSTFAPKSQEAEFTLYDDKDLTGSKVRAVIILDETIECDSWALVLENIMKKFFALDENLYDYVTSDDYLHRYIKADKDALRQPNSIEGTSYFYENNTNTNLKWDIVVRLAEHLELDKADIKVILSRVADESVEEPTILKDLSTETTSLYEKIENEVKNFGGDVIINPIKNQIAFKRGKRRFGSAWKRKNYLDIYALQVRRSPFQEVSKEDKWYFITLEKEKYELAVKMLKVAYDSLD